MARIRTIKPELLEDGKVARLPHLAWRLFVSLILLADDYGNLRGDPERIHGAVLWAHPREDSRDSREDFRTALGVLLATEFVISYEVRGQLYLHIAGWDRHQKVDHPGRPLCPALTDGSRVSRESLAKHSEGLAPDLGSGSVPGSGSGPTTIADPPAPTRSTPSAKVWNQHDWRDRFGRAWVAKYQTNAYGDAGDTKACVSLGYLLDAFPEHERLAAQDKAPEMFAEFLANTEPRVVSRRHPFLFFVQEFGGLRVSKRAQRPRTRAEENIAALDDWQPPEVKTA